MKYSDSLETEVEKFGKDAAGLPGRNQTIQPPEGYDGELDYAITQARRSFYQDLTSRR